MRVLLLSNTTTLSLSSLPPPRTPKSPIRSNFRRNSINWAEKALIGALGGALSFGLLVSSPSSSIAIEFSSSSSVQVQPFSQPPEFCSEDEGDETAELGSEPAVTSEGIVEEAWEIVNDSFLNTSRSRSFPETWQVNRYSHVRRWIVELARKKVTFFFFLFNQVSEVTE